MEKMLNSGAQRAPSSFLREERAQRRICVYDCRLGNKEATGKWFQTSGLDFNGFLQILLQEFEIGLHETFVLSTTDRTVVDFDKFEALQHGSTLHLLQKEDQALSVATMEHINFVPHYNTLIRCGMYEYYASEGQNSLPYALAELVDNALSATAKNTGVRTIEIRMMFDETLGKHAVIVIDNGCGMTSKQLNNWAVYRLPKFSRENTKLPSEQQGHVRPDPVRRYLNSDISYFGVGGKQATFYIGTSARMITKPVSMPDVHELVLSKEEFERKAKNKEDIYSGIIRNRKPGDSSHVNKSEHYLHALIAEEPGKESFTAVVITGIEPEHITFLTEHFESWTRQLAHVYHYYLYGGDGNDLNKSSSNSDHLPNIDIQVTLREKPHRCPYVMNLREVENDMQTLYINTAADTFDFKAFTEQDSGTVEGVIRYHPFLYDKETYPKGPNAVQATCDDNDVNHDDDDDDSGVHEAGEKKPIFNCFWNGRLIPFTTVSEFDWCKWSKESKVPKECYSRISGVLFTDDRFQVTTNKLTFVNLETKLREKSTIFTRIVNGQKQRGNIQKEFTQWLQSCHQKWDKQIQFQGYTKTITRTDVTKKMQHPWATFSSIEWDGKIYKRGQLVKSQKTNPILYGTVNQFLLHGDYKGDVFATGGYVEISLEPKALHDKTKIILISKIDQTATLEAIQTHIKSEFAKLPAKLKVDWPEGNPWPQNAVRAAGTALGPLRVNILNMKEESLSRMPTVGQGPVRKLVVELKLILHGANGDQEVTSCIAPHASKEWAFWFKKIGNLTHLGRYTVCLNTMISESNATIFGGRALPSYKLNFTIKEGNAECFITGALCSTARVGVPFDIPLLIKDGYDHPTAPPPNLKPVLKCIGLDLSYEKVDSSETTLTIRNVRASGKLPNYQQREPYNLKVTLPGMKKHTQGINIVLLPGKPHSLHVPEDKTSQDKAENGKPLRFDVEIHDEAGNVTAYPKQIVRCQVDGLPVVTADCSNSGIGQIVTKPIDLKILKGEPQRLKVQFEMPNQKNIASVMRELMVFPSTRVSCMELCSVNDENLVLRNNEKIDWQAGGVLENLIYRLYDEACREVPLTAEIASKIKVNWTADLVLADLIQGKLPDVHVPTQVHEQRFYQVSYQDQSASVSFTIVPRPDEPARLKATLTQNTVKLGEILPGDINLELVDQYDNVTKTLTRTCVNDIGVEAKGLDMSAITFMWQENSSSVRVTGVQFLAGTPGPREMSFTYKSYVAQVIVQVAPGVPEQLKLVNEPEKPLQVLNDHGIAVPFVVQLCDKWGNPSPDKRVVVELKSSSPILTVKTAVTSQPVNAEGKASFAINTVIGPKGSYQLEFKGSFNLKPIPGPSVTLTVIPDPNKPVNLAVDYDANARFPAGGKFPVFSVTVVSDEGSPMMNFNPAAASMFVWQEDAAAAAAAVPPCKETVLKCSKPMENEKTGCFYFRDKMIPESVGRHTIQFSLFVDQAKVIYSHQITVNVVANQPVKLSPDSPPPTPVVSYSKVIASRTLVENMTLRIMDSFGNPAGLDLNGKVKVSIKNLGGYNNTNLPLFENRTNSIQFSLVKGKAHISRLAVMENSPGQDGSSYTLIFEPEVSMVSTPLAPFELQFHFYNDEENQRKMSELAGKKDELTEKVNRYKEVFAGYSELLQMLTNQFLDASEKETEQRKMLNMKNMNITQSVSVPDIDILITEKTAEANRILNMPRRVCSIPDNFSGQQDVVGKVGHLAFLQDDDAARVISWHIRGDMDCVVTRTTAAAKRICNNSHGSQEVMPLDLVCVSAENRPLPHIRNGHVLFEPPGNPVYARDLLIYPEHHESCSKGFDGFLPYASFAVFKNILGDTILIDDMDSATSYRQRVVQNWAWCPTILTRQGNRVSAKGKFGGTHNKAPAIHQLQVFGAPLPKEYYILKELIDSLSQYRSTLEKKVKAAKEHSDHCAKLKSPVTLQKEQEMKEMEKQLEEIEKQCALLQARPAKRRLEVGSHPSGIIAKRAKERCTKEMH